MGKSSKVNHKHKPAIERILPIERIIRLFYESFDQPYLNPLAELTLQEFRTAFSDISGSSVEEALSYWTGHSGQKVLQTKLAILNGNDRQVWFIHGLQEGFVLGHEASVPLRNVE